MSNMGSCQWWRLIGGGKHQPFAFPPPSVRSRRGGDNTDRFSNAHLHDIMSYVPAGVGALFLVCKVGSRALMGALPPLCQSPDWETGVGEVDESVNDVVLLTLYGASVVIGYGHTSERDQLHHS